MRAGVVAALLLLAACGEETPPAPVESDSQYVLTCETYRALTPDDLTQRFGAENITRQTLPGPEGESYAATVVFTDDATRRLEIVWNAARNAPASISVDSPGTRWRTAQGYTIGTPIAEIETANGGPFKLWGFGWDYGGWVSDWMGGALADQAGCGARVRFEPRGEAGAGAVGDSEFRSNDAAVRAADPIVSAFGLLNSAG